MHTLTPGPAQHLKGHLDEGPSQCQTYAFKESGFMGKIPGVEEET